MPSVLLIFVDGLGIGVRDPGVNPLAAFQPRVLRLFQDRLGPFPRRGRCFPTDARLGVKGLPQSATGQTTLFTGVNAAALLGRHWQGFPTRPLRELIREHSLFVRLKRRHLRVTFANSYLPQFFDRPARRRSVTTVMCEAAGVPFWRLEDLRAGRSLFMDFTNRVLQERGYDIPRRTAEEAAQILLKLARRNHLCVYEYFLTDVVGHRGEFRRAIELLQQLDRFLLALIENADLRELSLICTSDHGNVEKMDQKQHTIHAVPTLVWGPIREELERHSGAFSLTDAAPLIENFLVAGAGKTKG